ncbi:U2 small nuclear ribonucleoprotein A'-like isoform X1 [Clarias magur]|uniref:U2 small nuclear ribonucleoprotein A'-like isoform X1 n=1 Tax=Clarias magur TaxID=1594786 RepID=A0A8J4X9W3_CLAMG|nr:U2 small nuclear ribonucleoprotein A'-like isoform X1 [Clarias magur]
MNGRVSLVLVMLGQKSRIFRKGLFMMVCSLHQQTNRRHRRVENDAIAVTLTLSHLRCDTKSCVMERGDLGSSTIEPGLKRLSFAYQSLLEIPYDDILKQQDTLEVLDLSYNLLDDPALLGELDKLSTLILDGNNYCTHVKFPYMPSLTTLWINKNRISNLPIIVEEIRCKFPNIKILSMMNNEAAPSYFNGGSLTQYLDYRQYVISQIPCLEVLDDTEVQEKERVQARKIYRLQESSKRRK